MKVYEILDSENELFIGTLLYYEKKKEFIIELDESLDEWNCPLLFTNSVKKKIFRMPRSLSGKWVTERVIPSGRQNISNILYNHKMLTYDEMNLLELAEGKCSQDHLYIRKLDFLPQYVKVRQRRNIEECVISGKSTLIVFFYDGVIRKIDLNELSDLRDIVKILNNELLFRSGKVGTGGYSVTFNDSIDVSCDLLYEKGELLPLTKENFLDFIRNSLVDTRECSEILDTSRQNIAYLKTRNKLNAVRDNVKGSLFLRGEVLENTW